MIMQASLRGLRALAIGLIAALALSAPASAHGGGHGGGGGHPRGFGFHGGGGREGFGGFHVRYAHRGGYRGGYGDWHRGYGYGGWGWPGYGLLLSTLPASYSTLWWDGVPNYYDDDSYYLWNKFADEYQTVNPPPDVVNQSTTQQIVTDLFAYPKNDQSTEQQAQDKQECRSWATAQTGFIPAQSGAGSATTHADAPASLTRREEYFRAQAACFGARGYTVR